MNELYEPIFIYDDLNNMNYINDPVNLNQCSSIVKEPRSPENNSAMFFYMTSNHTVTWYFPSQKMRDAMYEKIMELYGKEMNITEP